MIINKYNISHIIDARRLDPIFFRYDTKRFGTIYPLVSVGSCVVDMQSGIGAGKEEQADEKTGIIHIRPTNIDKEGCLIYDRNVYVPVNANIPTLSEDDILFNNTNSQELVGKTAILKENRQLMFSNHITRIRVNKSCIIPEYLWIILNIYQQERIFFSICTNWNNQSGIGIDLLKSVKIPLPPIEIQQQIVDIYSTAQKAKHAKEKQAKVLLNSVQNELGKILGITQAQEFVPAYKLHIKDIIGDRLDVKFHNPRYIDYIKSISRSTYYRLGDIVEFSSETWNQKDIFETHFPYIEIGAIDTTTGEIIDISNVEIGKAPSRAKKIVRHNDIIVSTTRPNRGAISIVDNEVCIASTGFSVIRDIKDIVLREFLYIVLRLESSLEQMMQRSSGGNYPAITEDELKKILIPIPPLEVQRKVINFVTENRRAVKQLQNESERLLGAVKVQIEKMILG